MGTVRKHLPRKDGDDNIARCILLNINEHVDTNHNDYRIDKARFDALISVMITNGIIKNISPEKQVTTTIQCCIADLIKFQEWKQHNFYRDITKYIIPFIEVGASVAVNALFI